MPAVLDVIQSIYTIAKAVHERIELVKANKAQCRTLNERTSVVVNAINGLDKVKNAEQYKSGLLALEDCLKETLEFVDEFSKEKSWFKKALKAGNAKEQFLELNEKLQKAINELNLGLNAQQIINHEQDKKDQKEDSESICNQQETIIKLNQEANQVLQKFQLQQAEQNIIILNQLASMRAQFAQISSPSKPRPLIEPHLTTTYYELIFQQKLAEGSFGKVYAGQWCKQPVAIKTINGELDEENMKLFIREVQIMSRLRSPNVVQLYSVCLEPKRPCLVMEYMEQGSLYAVLGKANLNPLQQKKVALDIAKGLWYLHNQGVLHRDLKSANILLNANGQAKLADFGLSKIGTSSIQSIHQDSQALEWQAPECLQREGQYSKASDIYSFGVILWEIISNQRPFARYKGSQREAHILEQVLAGKRDIIPNVPVYNKIIEGCWEVDPKQRINLEDIIESLETYQPAINPEEYYKQGLEYEKIGKLSEALAEYQKATGQGYYKAETNIGFFLLKGLAGLKENKQEAYERFLISAKKGHSRGMMNLASMLESGNGVEKNVDQALYWYEQAANQGDEKGKLKSQALRKK